MKAEFFCNTRHGKLTTLKTVRNNAQLSQLLFLALNCTVNKDEKPCSRASNFKLLSVPCAFIYFH